MSFLMPKAPKPIPPANAAQAPVSSFSKGADADDIGYSSLIASTPAGLQRKNSLNKTSLIGGG